MCWWWCYIFLLYPFVHTILLPNKVHSFWNRPPLVDSMFILHYSSHVHCLKIQFCCAAEAPTIHNMSIFFFINFPLQLIQTKLTLGELGYHWYVLFDKKKKKPLWYLNMCASLAFKASGLSVTNRVKSRKKGLARIKFIKCYLIFLAKCSNCLAVFRIFSK